MGTFGKVALGTAAVAGGAAFAYKKEILKKFSKGEDGDAPEKGAEDATPEASGQAEAAVKIPKSGTTTAKQTPKEESSSTGLIVSIVIVLLGFIAAAAAWSLLSSEDEEDEDEDSDDEDGRPALADAFAVPV